VKEKELYYGRKTKKNADISREENWKGRRLATFGP